jgi:hypothetical protein
MYVRYTVCIKRSSLYIPPSPLRGRPSYIHRCKDLTLSHSLAWLIPYPCPSQAQASQALAHGSSAWRAPSLTTFLVPSSAQSNAKNSKFAVICEAKRCKNCAQRFNFTVKSKISNKKERQDTDAQNF